MIGGLTLADINKRREALVEELNALNRAEDKLTKRGIGFKYTLIKKAIQRVTGANYVGQREANMMLGILRATEKPRDIEDCTGIVLDIQLRRFRLHTKHLGTDEQYRRDFEAVSKMYADFLMGFDD